MAMECSSKPQAPKRCVDTRPNLWYYKPTKVFDEKRGVENDPDAPATQSEDWICFDVKGMTACTEGEVCEDDKFCRKVTFEEDTKPSISGLV